MNVHFALKEVLERFGMRRQGALKELAARLDIGQPYLSAIINNHPRAKGIQYSHLTEICTWLLKNVPEKHRQELRSALPGALFHFVGLWDSLLQKPSVVMYLGERQREDDPSNELSSATIRWISGTDAAVATDIIHRLTRDGANFTLHWENVSRHVSDHSNRTSAAMMAKDKSAAIEMHKKSLGLRDCLILVVGSQRVNFMVEVLVAELTGCTPFAPFDAQSTVPVYLQYRSEDSAELASCFGGHTPPPGYSGNGGPGIYYRADDNWVYMPAREGAHDAGVVIVIDSSEESKNVQHLILFGFTVAGTKAIGKYFRDHPEHFWPLGNSLGPRRAGIFCCVLAKPAQETTGDSARLQVVDGSLVSLRFEN